MRESQPIGAGPSGVLVDRPGGSGLRVFSCPFIGRRRRASDCVGEGSLLLAGEGGLGRAWGRILETLSTS